MKDNREEKVYIRVLELLALASEDWGKVVENSNNFLKELNIGDAEQTLQELQKMKSPISELEAVLNLEIERVKNQEA